MSINAITMSMLLVLAPLTALTAPKHSAHELALARDYVFAACVMERYAGTPLAAEADAWTGGLVEHGRLQAEAYSELADLGRSAPKPGVSQNGTLMRLQSCIDFVSASGFPARLQKTLRHESSDATAPAEPGKRCTRGSEYEPPLCPIHLPNIKSVHIQENSAKAVPATDPNIDCASFKIDEKRLRRFWSQAKETNANDAHHTLDWSPCSASGTLEFANGTQAKWSVNQSRIGSLSIGGKDLLVLYCPTCTFKPFD